MLWVDIAGVIRYYGDCLESMVDSSESGEMRSEMDQVLLSKIEKIQALMDRAATQGEAEAAAEALERLMIRHQLEAVEVEVALHGRPGQGRASSVEGFEFGLERAMWKVNLLFAITKHNFGKAVHHPWTKSMTIIAAPENRAVILDLYARFVPLTSKMADRAWVSLGEWDQQFESSRAWKDSYRKGFVSGLSDAMWRAKQEEVASFDGGSALVLVRTEEVAAKTKEMFPRLTNSKVSIGSGNAYRRGQADGRSMTIGREVGSGAKKAIR
jgi:hypothetical protein